MMYKKAVDLFWDVLNTNHYLKFVLIPQKWLRQVYMWDNEPPPPPPPANVKCHENVHFKFMENEMLHKHWQPEQNLKPCKFHLQFTCTMLPVIFFARNV